MIFTGSRKRQTVRCLEEDFHVGDDLHRFKKKTNTEMFRERSTIVVPQICKT